MNNNGTTTYTYPDSGLYLTIEVLGYHRSRLYLSDDPELYGANYVDIECALNVETEIDIYFKKGMPQRVSIIDRHGYVKSVRSSDIDIQVSSLLKKESEISLGPWWNLSSADEGNDNQGNDTVRPYIWYDRVEWPGDSSMFLTPSLFYSVGSSLNYVLVYEDYGNNEGMRLLCQAEEVKFDFSWATFLYKFVKIK